MKRLFDLVLAVVLLPFLALFFVVILPIISRNLGERPLMSQVRLGRGRRPFKILKLKTMRSSRTEAEINDKELDRLRLTPLGYWLRNRGLDELPQIGNILLGQMSFTGPRAYLEKNYEKIRIDNPNMIRQVDHWERARLAVRPGLSGWHQIHSLGPGVIKYDLEYLDHWSLLKELKIFAVSIWIMMVGKDRYFKTGGRR